MTDGDTLTACIDCGVVPVVGNERCMSCDRTLLQSTVRLLHKELKRCRAERIKATHEATQWRSTTENQAGEICTQREEITELRTKVAELAALAENPQP